MQGLACATLRNALPAVHRAASERPKIGLAANGYANARSLYRMMRSGTVSKTFCRPVTPLGWHCALLSRCLHCGLCWDFTRIKRGCGGRALLSEFGKAGIGRRNPAPRQLFDALSALPQSLIRAGELGLGQLLPFARRRSDMVRVDCALDTSLDAMDDAADGRRRRWLRRCNAAQQGHRRNC
jgi:hypothetical protein